MPLSLVGDFKVGREFMKEDRRRRMNRIRSLERKHDRSIENGGSGLPASELKELNQLYRSIPFCSVSTMLPASIEGIIINVKLLQSFMRKLGSRYVCSIKVDERKLILTYKDKFKGNKGILELLDISQHFQGFTDIPKLEIVEDIYHE